MIDHTPSKVLSIVDQAIATCTAIIEQMEELQVRKIEFLEKVLTNEQPEVNLGDPE